MRPNRVPERLPSPAGARREIPFWSGRAQTQAYAATPTAACGVEHSAFPHATDRIETRTTVAGLEAQQALAGGAVRLGGMLCRPPLAIDANVRLTPVS